MEIIMKFTKPEWGKRDVLTEIKAAQDVIGALVKIRNDLWEYEKQYLIKNTSEEKPLLTDDEYRMYKTIAEHVVEMEKTIEIVRDYYKTKMNNHSEESDDNTGKN